jgi:predicted lipid-binding transport protein (Tim44 family)
MGILGAVLTYVPKVSTLILGAAGAAAGAAEGANSWYGSWVGGIVGGAVGGVVGWWDPGFVQFFGIALGLLVVVFGLGIQFMIFGYLFLSRVKFTNRKLATLFIYFIIDLIPLISAFIPGTTLGLMLVRRMENKDRKKQNERVQQQNFLASAAAAHA